MSEMREMREISEISEMPEMPEMSEMSEMSEIVKYWNARNIYCCAFALPVAIGIENDTWLHWRCLVFSVRRSALSI